ncbi:inositol hexakisphosphate kinase 1-like [Dendronephthya gigantea]|uniref:inositol hexakisphosphate kinase 1-like n=1 Tax=Dendronephthya gigantea TaxID=151771 RepID=UPI0010698FC1|nr:inositol hexakisphosphate kinase 1-like [Dendronephthya gigantea]
MEENQRYSTIVSLEPFIHQVGGHSSIQQIDQYTVCKPLFSKELRFYQEVCSLFKAFIPEFKGVVNLKNIGGNGGKSWQMVSSGDKIKHHSYRYGKHCSSCMCQKKEEKEATQMYEEVLSKVSNDGGQARKDQALDSVADHMNDDSSLECILLENVVGYYKFPCILDLKMGTQKHSDYVVSKEEADRRQARWDQTTSKSLGVRVCGMKVYLVTQDSFLVKSHGRDLTIEGFKDAIKGFLFNGKESRHDVIAAFLTQLGKLLNIMERQSSYRFYNTSLLLIYEGDVSRSVYNTSTNNEDDSERYSIGQTNSLALQTNVAVRMIDFAHVQHNNQNMSSEITHGLDESYLFGLRSVIKILNETLEELKSNNRSL